MFHHCCRNHNDDHDELRSTEFIQILNLNLMGVKKSPQLYQLILVTLLSHSQKLI